MQMFMLVKNWVRVFPEGEVWGVAWRVFQGAVWGVAWRVFQGAVWGVAERWILQFRKMTFSF